MGVQVANIGSDGEYCGLVILWRFHDGDSFIDNIFSSVQRSRLGGHLPL